MHPVRMHEHVLKITAKPACRRGPYLGDPDVLDIFDNDDTLRLRVRIAYIVYGSSLRGTLGSLGFVAAAEMQLDMLESA